jgi:hypothetical protein
MEQGEGPHRVFILLSQAGQTRRKETPHTLFLVFKEQLAPARASIQSKDDRLHGLWYRESREGALRTA